MARFAAICQGTRARKRGVPFTTLTGVEATCDLRILSGADDEAILAAATAVAKKAGARAEEGDLVFDFARACEVVARAAVDPESPDTAPIPYFDSVEQVKEHLDRDRIALLFDAQCAFQDETSPRGGADVDLEKLVEMIYASTLLPEGSELPFERLRPVLRRSCMRTLAALVVKSGVLKSLSSSGSDSSSPETSDTSLHS